MQFHAMRCTINRFVLPTLELLRLQLDAYFLLQNRFWFNIVNVFGLFSVRQQHRYQRTRLQTMQTAKLL